MLFTTPHDYYSDDHWIGLCREENDDCSYCSSGQQNSSCLACRQQWTWTDGSPMLNDNGNLLYNKWGEREPTSTPNMQCARLYNTEGKKWYDTTCSQGFDFFCKKGRKFMGYVILIFVMHCIESSDYHRPFVS